VEWSGLIEGRFGPSKLKFQVGEFPTRIVADAARSHFERNLARKAQPEVAPSGTVRKSTLDTGVFAETLG
jgi:hypothetical protein